MAEQIIYDMLVPLAKRTENDLVPIMGLMQERNGVYEPFIPSASYQLDTTTGLFLPTNKDNPLEARVRDLEALFQSGDAKVQLTGHIAERDTIVESFAGEMAPDSNIVTLIDIKNLPIHLEVMSIYCGGHLHASGVQVEIRPYLANGTLGNALGLPRYLSGTASITTIRPVTLYDTSWDGESDLFKLYKYDTENNEFSLGLKRPYPMNNGGRIRIIYANPTPIQVAAVASISVWDKIGVN